MKIRATAGAVYSAIEMRAAKVTADIEEAEQRVQALVPDAENSESTRKALTQIRAAIDRARKVRDNLAAMDRTLRGLDVTAEIELNDNECAVFSFVHLEPVP